MLRRNGVTLIEVLFVLGIMAILIGIVMVLYSQNVQKTKAIKAQEELIFIVHSVQELYGETNNKKTFDNEAALAIYVQKSNPTYVNSSATNLVNPWGGYIAVGYQGEGIFNLSTYSLDKNGCIALSISDVSKLATAMTINGSYYNNGSPVSPQIATQYCQPTNNFVGWNFSF